MFIQDVEGIPCNSKNWDYVHPENLFNTLKALGILDNSHKQNVFEAYLEVRSYNDWEELVGSYGTNWDDDIYLYPNMDFNDLAYHMIHEVYCYEIPKYLENYIDYDAYGRDLSYEGFYEYANGIIELR